MRGLVRVFLHILDSWLPFVSDRKHFSARWVYCVHSNHRLILNKVLIYSFDFVHACLAAPARPLKLIVTFPPPVSRRARPPKLSVIRAFDVPAGCAQGINMDNKFPSNFPVSLFTLKEIWRRGRQVSPDRLFQARSKSESARGHQ